MKKDKISYLEKLRKKVLTHLIIIIVASIIVAITIGIIVSPKVKAINIVLVIFIISGLVTYFLLNLITGYKKKFKDYKAYYKKLMVEEPFQETFGHVNFDYKKGIDKDTIKNTGIMSLGNRYYSNDYLQGSYKGVRFERADIKIQNRVYTGKHSFTVTYFNGRWITLEFDGNYNFNLQIIGKGFKHAATKSSFFRKKECRRSKIELEDKVFNELFTVYAQSDHEAKYILTPEFIDTLKNMFYAIDGNFMLGFIDNKLHVAINTNKDAMEPSLIKNLYTTIDVQKEIKIIINIIEKIKPSLYLQFKWNL